MGKLNPEFPPNIWDGSTSNPDRLDEHSNVDPDLHDWDRISEEVVSMQRLIPFNHSGCEAVSSTNQSIPNEVGTSITFSAELWDTDNYHSVATDTHLLTVPTDGLYLCYGYCKWDTNTTNKRVLELKFDGAVLRGGESVGAGVGVPKQSNMWIMPLNASQTIELVVFQDSGISVNITEAQFGVVRLLDLTYSTLGL